MAEKVIIFDFDGTIADTTDSIVRILNHLANRFGYKDVDLNKLRNKGSEEIRKELGISFIKIPFIVRRVRSELNKEIESLKPITGLRNPLFELKRYGYKLGILTSNSKKNVSKFLINNNLDFFDFIHSEGSVFRKNKALEALLKEKNLADQDVVYVGDETRDIEAAKDTDIKVIAVSWGFNSKEILKKQNPDFLIDNPEELIKILKDIS